MSPLNIFGRPLKSCCFKPMTGFFRDGFCRTDEHDHGSHTVCALVTEEFLSMSKYLGNDLSTPRPEFNFPGLVPGDKWCVCARRWLEAHENDCAPPLVLEACHQRALDIVPLEIMQKYAAKESL